MRKVFYLFRHGETNYNLEKRWQGCGVDSLLNQTGIKQAEELAEKIQNLGIEIIYSSELKRALQTGTVAAAKLGVELKTMPDLREGCFGEAEGLLRDEVERKFPDVFKAWYSPENDMNMGFPGGETKQEMQDRMCAVLQNLLNAPEKIIGISSHSSSIRYLLMKFGLPPHKMPNTTLFKVVYDNGSWTAEQIKV